MVNQTLSAALESAGGDESNAPDFSAAPQEGQAPESSTPAEFVGFTPDTPQQPTQAELKLAESLTPETVVMHGPDGKPITAAEVLSGHLRQSDYTRKTQEVAEQRKTQEQAIQFYEENLDFIQRMQSPDPQVRAAVFEELRQNFQVPTTQTRARDDSGRFTAGEQDSELYDLSQIEDPDSLEFAKRHNATVERARKAEAGVKGLEAKLDQFMSGLTQAQTQAQNYEAAQQIASQWNANGLKADVDGALALVGKPLTVDQAMRLHHWEAALRHTHEVTKRKLSGELPNEPGGGAARPRDTQGLSLSQRLEMGG